MKQPTTQRLALSVIASALLATGLASAQSTGGPSTDETTPPSANTPPEKAAIDACVGKKKGERVYFTTSKGKKRHWTCALADGVLAARPGVATAARPDKK